MPQFSILAKEGQPMRVAIYARVSTNNQQTLGMQVEAMSADIKCTRVQAVRLSGRCKSRVHADCSAIAR